MKPIAERFWDNVQKDVDRATELRMAEFSQDGNGHKRIVKEIAEGLALDKNQRV